MKISSSNRPPYGLYTDLTSIEYQREYRRRKPEQCILSAARNRARNRGLPFDITVADIFLPTHCPILGIELTRNFGKNGGTASSASLDRIIPELGYIKGNIQVISLLANNMKSYATADQLRAFAKWIMETYK